MPIFISYSRKDSAFVDRLAAQLIQNKVNVWLDRWELSVGDSLLSKIQDAITGASALLVILSPASVGSSWVQKEVNSGLLRELEKRRVVVLPVLVEDCPIPVFLREKLYADFRSDFDSGLRMILEAVARVVNPDTGRVDDPSYHVDWAIDWGMVEDRAHFRLDIVEQANDQPYTVLATVEIAANANATRAYTEMEQAGRAEEARRRIVELIVDFANTPDDLEMLLEDQFPRTHEYVAIDQRVAYRVHVSARRLGADTGRDVLFRAGQQLREIVKHLNDVATGPPE